MPFPILVGIYSWASEYAAVRGSGDRVEEAAPPRLVEPIPTRYLEVRVRIRRRHNARVAPQCVISDYIVPSLSVPEIVPAGPTFGGRERATLTVRR
jgi:hypothetical protein